MEHHMDQHLRAMLDMDLDDLERESKRNFDNVTCETVHEWVDTNPDIPKSVEKIAWIQRNGFIIEGMFFENDKCGQRTWTLSFNANSRKIFQIALSRILNDLDDTGELKLYRSESHIAVGDHCDAIPYCEYYPRRPETHAPHGEVSHAEFLAHGGIDISQWVDSISEHCGTYAEGVEYLLNAYNLVNGITITCNREEESLLICVNDSNNHQIARFVYDGETTELDRVEAYAIMFDATTGKRVQVEHYVLYSSANDEDDDEETE